MGVAADVYRVIHESSHRNAMSEISRSRERRRALSIFHRARALPDDFSDFRTADAAVVTLFGMEPVQFTSRQLVAASTIPLRNHRAAS